MMKKKLFPNLDFHCHYPKKPKPLLSAKRTKPEDEADSFQNRVRSVAHYNAKVMEELKAEYRKRLPKLTTKEIRRHRSPACEWIPEELEEAGYTKSAELIKVLLETEQRLLDFDRDCPSRNLPTPLGKKPVLLKSSSKTLMKLRDNLQVSENENRRGRYDLEAKKFLETAEIFMNEGKKHWWWIAEFILNLSVEAAEKYKADGGYNEAIMRIKFSQFLSKNLNEKDEAQNQLEIARSLSVGKTWRAGEFDCADESLHYECCRRLNKILLEISEREIELDSIKTIFIAKRAVKRAIEGNLKEGTCSALFGLAKCYMKNNNYPAAIESLEQYLNIILELSDYEKYCNGLFEKAVCLKLLGRIDECRELLKEMLEISETKGLQNCQAKAHQFLGEIYLNADESEEASFHLKSAFSLYYSLRMIEKVDYLRCLAGISIGHELMEDYIKSVTKAYDQDSQELEKLIHWKDRRKMFYTSSTALGHIPPKLKETFSVPSSYSLKMVRTLGYIGMLLDNDANESSIQNLWGTESNTLSIQRRETSVIPEKKF